MLLLLQYYLNAITATPFFEEKYHLIVNITFKFWLATQSKQNYICSSSVFLLSLDVLILRIKAIDIFIILSRICLGI